MKWFAVPMAVLLVGLVVSRTQAATITTSASTPTGNVEISQLNLDNSTEPYEQVVRRAATGTNYRELGQTFTVTSGFTLDKISVLFKQPSGPAEDPYGYLNSNLPLYMDVFGVDNTGDFTGTSLAGYPDSGASDAFSYDTNLWMTFDLADIALSPGTYGFRVGFTAVSGANSIGDRGSGEGGIGVWRNTDETIEDPYADGQMFRLFPSTVAYSSPAIDLVFVVQSVPAGIPEPSAFALAGLAILGLVGRGRRRRV